LKSEKNVKYVFSNTGGMVWRGNSVGLANCNASHIHWPSRKDWGAV